MAGAKNHDYHILPPSIWPIAGAFAALAMASGGIMWMHSAAGGGALFFAGVAGVLAVMYGWWRQVVIEAHAGDHTPVVQLHLRYGMILFIASEVMFFVGWFWAYFDFSLFPAHIAYDSASSTPPASSPMPRRARRSGRPRGWKSSTPSASRCSTR